MIRTNAQNVCTSTSAAIAAACTHWITRYVSRGPCRSATRPAGTPATRPTRAATPMAGPTCVTDRPTERVKNNAAPVMKRPLPIMLMNVASASVCRGPRSSSTPRAISHDGRGRHRDCDGVPADVLPEVSSVLKVCWIPFSESPLAAQDYARGGAAPKGDLTWRNVTSVTGTGGRPPEVVMSDGPPDSTS